MELTFESLVSDESYEPAPWQLEDLSYLETLNVSANWSQMGCYKTTTGLWLADRKIADHPNPSVLIVTTKAGKGPYFDALPKTVPSWRVFNVGTRKASERMGDVELAVDIELDILLPLQEGKFNSPVVVLAHYDCFTNKAPIRKWLSGHKWTLLICDEAHKIKNKDVQWSRNVKKLSATYKHVMTGTGFVNRPDEIWSLLHFLDKERWPGYWSFRRRYCDEYRHDGGYSVIDGLKESMIPEFRAIRKSLGPNRKMAEVHAGIGHPIEAVRPVDLNVTQRRMYDEVKTYLRTLDEQGEPITSPNVLSQLNRLRQICVATPEVVGRHYDEKTERLITDIKLVEPSSKLDDVMEVLGELQWDNEERQQAVIFCSFKDPLYLLEERFKKADIPYLHLQTRHNEQQRYEMWHDVFPRKEHRVFMSTVQLGGESINLTPAQYLIFLDKDWSPKNMMQAIGRVYRPGQVNVPEVVYIQAKRSIDQRITNLLNIKGRWFNAIFDNEEA